MIVLAVTWMAAPGKEAEVTEVFRMLEEASRQEPGCLLYVVHQHRSDSRRFFIYEQYTDDTALAAHRQSVHFQEYAVKALSGIGTRLEGEFYLPITPAGSST
jgi:quinol monooxygenase YgiN